MRRWPIVLVVGITAGLAGPRAFGPKSHPAGAPFAYVPPEGLVPASPTSKPADADGALAWESPGDEPSGHAVVVVHHSTMPMQVDEASLAKMSAEMPKAFEESGCDWVHRRHETRVRPDGARAGLIEGECEASVDLSGVGLPSKTVKSRRLQLVFPDDAGTSIATISYPADQASRWAPAFEASIDRAKGVATRFPPPPLESYLLWAAGGLALGALAAAVLARKAPRAEGAR